MFAWCSLTTNPHTALCTALCTALYILRIKRWIAHSILVRTVALPGQPIQPTVCVRVGVLARAHTYLYGNVKCNQDHTLTCACARTHARTHAHRVFNRYFPLPRARAPARTRTHTHTHTHMHTQGTQSILPACSCTRTHACVRRHGRARYSIDACRILVPDGEARCVR